jgi:hypothetical protein
MISSHGLLYALYSDNKTSLFQSLTGGIAVDQPIKRPDSSVAIQALVEAKARHDAAQSFNDKQTVPAEVGGRGGQDPARFGDWEVRGIAYDF